MLLFKSLRYKNFLAAGNSFIEIDLLNNKRTLVVGANGAGKSTITSALCFGLFGKDFRGINKPQLINSINKKNLLVEVEFDVRGDSYLVRRGVKPNLFEIYRNGSLLDQDAAIRDQQDYLEKHILQINLSTFRQVVVLGSGNYVPFMKLTAGSRRDIIEDLLDLKVFSKMSAVLKERVSEHKTMFTQVENALQLERDRYNMEYRNLQAIEQEQSSKRTTLNNEINDLEADNVVKRTKIEEILEKSEKLGEKVEKGKEVEAKRSSYQSDIRLLDSDVRSAKKELSFYEINSSCPTCKQIITEDFKAEIVSEKTSLMESKQTKIDELSVKLKKTEEALEIISQLNDQYRKIQQLLMKYESEVSSNTATIRRLTRELETLDESNTRRQESEQIIDELRTKIENLSKEKTKLEDEKAILTVAAALLKDSGTKASVLSVYVPLINELVNSYLEAMDFYVGFNLDENFNETVKSRHRDDFTYEMFSEGEKQRIDLALLFTWRQIARKKNSIDCNLLFLDEIGESSLDGVGVETVMKILGSLTDTNIFVISHNVQLKESDSEFFDCVLEFTKKQNFSYLETYR